MIDNIDNSTVAAPVAEPKRKLVRGQLNKAHLQKLTKAEGVAQAAKKTEYSTRLAAREITEEYVTDFIDDTDAARVKAAEAVQFSNASKTATADEFKAAHILIAALQEVQKAAKQKYARTNRIVLADFFVGKKLNGNRPNLLQTSQTIVNKLGNDTLPGITNAKVTKLKNLRVFWIGSNKAQKDSVSAAQSARAELKTMLKSIEDRKVAIQLAADAEWPHADAEWPHADENNAAVRREFGLSPTKPFHA